MLRILFALTMIAIYLQKPAFADDVVIEYTWKGHVNKKPINGTGELTINEDGKLNATADFTEIPKTFSPSVLDNSFLCFQCIIGHEGGDGLQSLLTNNGDQVFSYRSFLIEDEASKVIGAIVVSGELEKVGKNKYVTRADVNGQYSGPVEDVKVGNYTLNLRPSRDGRLVGSYEASFEANGKKHKIYASTEYNYSNSLPSFVATANSRNLTTKGLSFGINFEKSTFDGKQLKFSGTRALSTLAGWGAKVHNQYPEPVECWTGEPKPSTGNKNFFTVTGQGGSSPDDVDVDHVKSPNGQWYKCGEDLTGQRLVIVEPSGTVRNAKCKTNGPNQDCAE